MSAHRIAASGVLILAALAACKAGPDYQPQEPAVAPAFEQAAVGSAIGAPSVADAATPPAVEWWSTLHDAELDSLIARATAGNLTLQQAKSRIREARARLAGAGAELAPKVSASAGYAYVDTGDGFTLGSNGALQTSVYTLGLSASWELDLFGGDRRAVEATAADYDGSVEEERGVRLSLLAEVARDYLALRGLQRRLAIAQENLALQQDTLELTRSQQSSGIGTGFDVSRARTEVAHTRSQIAPLEAAVVQARHALATLLGAEPGALAAELAAPAPIPVAPPSVGVGVPAELLRRRPDLRLAERHLAAANARIGAALSDYWPKLRLTGAFGTESNQFDTLFHFSSRYFLIYPSVSWSLLDFGRTKAAVDTARARYEQADLDYRERLLVALREVEDALVAYAREQEHRAALAEAATSARDSFDIARARYQQGLSDFLQVLDVQRQLLFAEDELALSDQAIATDLVALYKALGGGWESGETEAQPVADGAKRWRDAASAGRW